MLHAIQRDGRRRARSGSALVLALIVVVMVAGLGAGLLQVSMSMSRRQSAEIDAQRAFYLAEAGLAESFAAVRMGRTGQVGSEAAPAACGDGLVWVDATETADGQVRLVSTGLYGKGRAALAYVVEPVEIPLGVFADEDLVVESVLLVDGFNSQETTYEEAVEIVGGAADPIVEPDPAPAPLSSTALKLGAAILDAGARDSLEKHLGDGSADGPQKVASKAGFGDDATLLLEQQWPAFLEAYQAGTLFEQLDAVVSPDQTLELEPRLDVNLDGAAVLSDAATYGGDGVYTIDDGGAGYGTPVDQDPGGPLSVLGSTTGAGGMLASNGDIHFTSPSGEPVEIFGDVVPGVGGDVITGAGVRVTGSTDARTLPVELPEVTVPDVPLASPFRHDGLLPYLVSPGTTGFTRIEVAADSELCLRGPATIVIGELILEPGAILTLDTRDGDVDLFVTQGMDLQPGSEVLTSSDRPGDVSVQVAAIESGVDGAPVKLDATAQFYGTIFAPDAEVRVGSAFEVYGGIVARKLEIGAGARLHFDNAEYEGSPIPRIVAWRIVELPAAVRGQSDPFELLGVTRRTAPALADAHDLAQVWLSLTYLDTGGTERTYDGTEDLFDWDLVSAIVRIERDPTRVQEESSDAPPLPEPEPEPAPQQPGTEQQALDLLANSPLSSPELAQALIDSGQLSERLLRDAIASPKLDSWDLYGILLKAGPTKAGFPGAAGDAPLSDALLLDLVASDYDTQALSWTLEQNSPLSSQLLDAVTHRNPPLPARDLNYILRWQ